jgi:MFS family permease
MEWNIKLISEPVARLPEHRDVSGGAYSWFVLALLTTAYSLSFLDRQIVSLLFAPIRRDLHISDTEVSLLSGIAFAGLYAFLGIPVARLADRGRRVHIIAVGVLLWSGMTSAGGFAKTFPQLFFTRMGVGIGEATLSPAAYSLLSDLFPPDRVARAIGVYTLAIYLGMGGAMLLGSFLVGAVESMPALQIAGAGRFHSWQIVLMWVGTPGLALAIVLARIREPPRRRYSTTIESASGAPGGDEPLHRFLRKRWPLYLFHMLGFSLAGLYGAALSTWVPELFRRAYGWPVSKTGMAFGIILLVFGAPAALLGGWYADRQRSRGALDAPIKLALTAIVPLGICGALLPMAPNAEIALALLAVCIFCFGFPGGLAPSALQLITPNRYRARISAVYLLATTLLGQGAGPTVVALASDYVFRDENSLPKALSLVAAIAIPASVLCLWAALRPYRNAANIAPDV